ncbi:MAG TPA: carboxylesterase family protein, partial [Prolixibacteraceae bacterium]|nr:carboxylesterase family protein [Prolixibacteraceae bacterium]
MKKSILFAMALALLVITSCHKPQPGQVRVEGGWIQGTVTEDLTIYKGIPFAAPPVGDLRWKAPRPVHPWKGILQTTE